MRNITTTLALLAYCTFAQSGGPCPPGCGFDPPNDPPYCKDCGNPDDPDDPSDDEKPIEPDLSQFPDWWTQ